MQEAAEEIKVIYRSEDLLAVYKEKGLATVPLKKNPEGDSLLKRLSLEYPEVTAVCGRNSWEGGIIHRLDTPTSGIVIAARNQKSYDELVRAQKLDLIKKRYIAVVSKRDERIEGFEDFPYKWNGDSLSVSSFFRSYGERAASVRPVLNNRRFISGETYKTEIRKVDENTFECVITRGFRHQIRSHLAWAGYPIVGDDRYGGEENESLLLEACSVSFPFQSKVLEISL